MKFLGVVFFFVQAVGGGFSFAHARLPETKAERSLLYWRYLCQDEPQEEKVQNQVRELRCKTQSWKVRAPASSGKVLEVIEE